VRFLVDSQLPSALSRWLQEKGHQAEHVFDVGLAQSKDNPVWNDAGQHGAAIITKDEDFAEWVRRGRLGPSVVWLRVGNSSKRALLKWFDLLLPLVVQKLQEGERLIELR
jgi:predicted nuclease of predicted toxin-antitoxin system